MAYALGMFLGAFFLLLSLYSWYYRDEDAPFLPLYMLWYDTCFHSRASLRRVAKVWKTNRIFAMSGAIMGWGMTDSVVQFLAR